jgi:hypothetical protein
MKGSLVFLSLCGLMSGIISAAPARADLLTADFTIDNGNPSASGGEITFVLNGDGTISADLISTLAGAFQGFGFDSVGVNLPESNFAPTTPDNTYGWSDFYGYHASGFYCSSCGTSETWTIGTPGEFTSVFQALGGNNASTDFFLYSQNGDQWGADAASAVPEGSTWAMMLLGFAGLGFVGYRQRQRTAAESPRRPLFGAAGYKLNAAPHTRC